MYVGYQTKKECETNALQHLRRPIPERGAVRQAGALYPKAGPAGGCPGGMALLRSVRDRPGSGQACHPGRQNSVGPYRNGPLPRPAEAGNYPDPPDQKQLLAARRAAGSGGFLRETPA